MQLAQSKTVDLIKRVKGGEKFDPAAKALGLDPKTSEPFAAKRLQSLVLAAVSNSPPLSL